MPLITEPPPVYRPPSPWPGSQYQTQHRWQLDGVRSLPDAARVLRELATELTAADAAGWRLVEPMSGGHLLAARPSRRQRAQLAPAPSTPTAWPIAVSPVWRLRLIDDHPLADEPALDAAAVTGSPVLAWTGGGLDQISGAALPPEVLSEIARQVAPSDLVERRWAVAAARVIVGFDLVADGSALRGHAVAAGVLVRTVEALTFQHAADGATTLLVAAAAYERLAELAEAMAAAGGRLTGADDGFLQVEYVRVAP